MNRDIELFGHAAQTTYCALSSQIHEAVVRYGVRAVKCRHDEFLADFKATVNAMAKAHPDHIPNEAVESGFSLAIEAWTSGLHEARQFINPKMYYERAAMAAGRVMNERLQAVGLEVTMFEIVARPVEGGAA